MVAGLLLQNWTQNFSSYVLILRQVSGRPYKIEIEPHFIQNLDENQAIQFEYEECGLNASPE